MPEDLAVTDIPAAIRKTARQDLKQHAEYIQYILEKEPGRADEDDLLMVKLELAQARQCIKGR